MTSPGQPSILVRLILCVLPLLSSLSGQSYKGIDNTKETTLAVTRFSGHALTDEDLESMTQLCHTLISETVAFRPMGRSRMREILRNQGYTAPEKCGDQECMVELGTLLGVETVLAGSVGKVGQTFSVTVRLIDVETGRVVRTANHFHNGDFDGVLSEALPKIVEILSGKTRSAPRPLSTEVPVRHKRNGDGIKETKRKVLLPAVIGLAVLAGGSAVLIVLK